MIIKKEKKKNGDGLTQKDYKNTIPIVFKLFL